MNAGEDVRRGEGQCAVHTVAIPKEISIEVSPKAQYVTQLYKCWAYTESTLSPPRENLHFIALAY